MRTVPFPQVGEEPAGASPALTKFAWLSIAAALVTIALKTGAFAVTGSVGLLSDAAESLVNLVAAVVALVALRVAVRPADARHQFGHGKAEYFSAGIEGLMIFVAAGVILVSAVLRFLHPVALESIGLGLAISTAASAVNGAVAVVLLRAGRAHRSVTLTADGKHLLTDVWTSVGVIVAFDGAARLGCVEELDALCREAVLPRAGDLPDDELLFLNVSPDVFADGVQVGERLRAEVEGAGLTPERVVIELTEHAWERPDPADVPVGELRELGFQLALDDVGSTGSGLGVLTALGPDYVKVDPAVVRGAQIGSTGRAVLAAIVAFAAEAGQVVIAEGIETLDMLHTVGAARTVGRVTRFAGAQGYLLGRPAADPPWRSSTPVAWPLPGIVIGPAELVAAEDPSECWCGLSGGW